MDTETHLNNNILILKLIWTTKDYIIDLNAIANDKLKKKQYFFAHRKSEISLFSTVYKLNLDET